MSLTRPEEHPPLPCPEFVPLRDWFRSPRSLLTLYLAGAAMAVACLVWLAVRQLHQQAALDAQRTTERLQGAANLAAARSQQALADLERVLSADMPNVPERTSVVRMRDGGVTVIAGALPFVPIGPVSSEMPAAAFDPAEQIEFAPDGRLRAANQYRALAHSSSVPIRAGALMRLGRVLRQLERHDQALAAYAELAKFTDVVIEGRPAGLIARLGRCAVLEAAGRRDELVREAVGLRADLARGRWPITSALWASVFETTTRWAGPSAPLLANLEHDVASAGALERYWQRRQGVPPAGASRMTISTAQGPVVIIEQARSDGARALVAGPESVESIRRHLTDATFAIRLVDAGARLPVQPGTKSLTLQAVESGLPWDIVVSDADPDRARDESLARRTTFLAGLALVGALILASGYFTFRGIRREVAIARLQADFVSAVSHEFRTPLTSIRQLSHLLHTGRVQDDERREQYYGVLVREAERLHRLVERLLSFGRAEAERFRFESVDACHLARAVVTEFSQQTVTRPIDVSTPSSPCPLRADREMLELALWNLLDNAVKYSSDAEPVRVDVAPRDGGVAIAVHDRGVGIAPHDQRRIFEKFVRGSADRVAATTGSGLGLALVDRVVRAHGGRIEVDSEPGRGSVFTLLMPAIGSGSSR
jgi:signal transduction histidine kinase